MSTQLLDANTTADLVTMLLPVAGKNLLVPNVSVAEIVHVSEPAAIEDVPTWFAGTITWRNVAIPLISFEAINEEPFQQATPDKRIAILNASQDGSRLPFFGVVTQGTPRMMRIGPEEISEQGDAPGGPAESMVVNVSGEEAVIPNMAFIENQLLRVLGEAKLEVNLA